MSIVDFQPAVRKGSHVIIVYYGESGCGKTLSAIKTARGLVGPNGRFAVLDTENERALVYAKEAGGWLHANLTPPFTPDRYIQSIKTAEDAGFECLVIDSGSHEWEGLGGILEMADGNGQRGLVKWAGPKAAHKRYVQALLQTRMHLIICLRAKEKVRQLTAADTLPPGRKVGDVISDGFVSIQDKRFIYEATVQIFLPNPQARSAKRGVPMIEKCPQDLLGAFNETAQIGIDTGERIREWINGGAPVDHALETLRRRADEAAGKGAESFRAFWKATSAADRGKLQPLMDNLRSIAIAADAERERQQQTAVQQNTSEADASLDDPFGVSSAKAAASPGFALVSPDGEVKWAGGNAADFTEHLIQALVNAGSPGDLAALEMENSTDIARLAADQCARISKAIDERRALFGKSDAAA
jgi:hypothetical protein